MASKIRLNIKTPSVHSDYQACHVVSLNQLDFYNKYYKCPFITELRDYRDVEHIKQNTSKYGQLTSVMTTSPRNMLCVIKEVEFNYGMLH
jgi:hypothetical protein